MRGKARFFKKKIFSLGKNDQKWQKSSYANPSLVPRTILKIRFLFIAKSSAGDEFGTNPITGKILVHEL